MRRIKSSIRATSGFDGIELTGTFARRKWNFKRPPNGGVGKVNDGRDLPQTSDLSQDVKILGQHCVARCDVEHSFTC